MDTRREKKKHGTEMETVVMSGTCHATEHRMMSRYNGGTFENSEILSGLFNFGAELDKTWHDHLQKCNYVTEFPNKFRMTFWIAC